MKKRNVLDQEASAQNPNLYNNERSFTQSLDPKPPALNPEADLGVIKPQNPTAPDLDRRKSFSQKTAHPPLPRPPSPRVPLLKKQCESVRTYPLRTSAKALEICGLSTNLMVLRHVIRNILRQEALNVPSVRPIPKKTCPAILRRALKSLPETLSLRWTPHPVIVTIRDNRDYIRVLLYSSYTTITGWGVLLSYPLNCYQLRDARCRPSAGLGV